MTTIYRTLIPTAPKYPGPLSGYSSSNDHRLSLSKPKHRRTRNGCSVCRSRKLKCDERRPKCSRCVTDRRACSYQETRTGSSDGIVLNIRNQHATITALRPSSNPYISQEPLDAHFLDVFLSSVITILPGRSPMRAWRILMPQLCGFESAITHAALAVSALYEETANRSTSEGIDRQAQNYALKHYGMALGQVQKHLRDPNGSPAVVLMVCLLFTAFESLRGEIKNAILHIESGNKLLQDLRIRAIPKAGQIEQPAQYQRTASSSYSNNEESGKMLMSDVDQEYMSRSLAKLAELTGSVEDASSQPLPTSIIHASFDVPACPTNFATLDEGRAAIFALGTSARVHISERHRPRSDHAKARLLFLDAQLTKALDALDRLLMRASDDDATGVSSAMEQSEAIILKIWAKFASIRLFVTMMPSEDALDAIVPDHSKLLDMIESVQDLDFQRQAAAHPKREPRPAVLTMEMGVLPVLHMVGQQCPDRDVKLRALRLVDRSPRREALWDADAVRTTILQSLEEHEAGSEVGGEQGADIDKTQTLVFRPRRSEDQSKPVDYWQNIMYRPNVDDQASLSQGHSRPLPRDPIVEHTFFATDPVETPFLYKLQVFGEMPTNWSTMP